MKELWLMFAFYLIGLGVGYLAFSGVKSDTPIEPYKVVITKKNGKMHKVFYYKNE